MIHCILTRSTQNSTAAASSWRSPSRLPPQVRLLLLRLLLLILLLFICAYPFFLDYTSASLHFTTLRSSHYATDISNLDSEEIQKLQYEQLEGKAVNKPVLAESTMKCGLSSCNIRVGLLNCPCKSIKYCGSEHSTQDWPRHKDEHKLKLKTKKK